jgi:hypothetical protein
MNNSLFLIMGLVVFVILIATAPSAVLLGGLGGALVWVVCDRLEN